MADFSDELAAIAALVDPLIADLLPDGAGPEARLFEAMHYAALSPGKRLRPFLTISSARMFGVPDAQSLRVAAAVELVHSYSLIHDDLPAMDDDDLRRGRPTVHRAFDEATAILAGDALLPLAFEILADEATHANASVRNGLIAGLAKAIGARGMVGGQMLDLHPPQPATYGDVVRMERLKTGALFAFACEAGAMLGEANTAARAALFAYAMDMGLAFQIVDDLLDHLGDEAELGKRVGKDSDAGKVTAITALGPDAARDQAHLLIEQALAHIAGMDLNAQPLRDAAVFVIERRA